MAYVIADNIISPMGTTTEANYRAVMAGRSALVPHKAHPSGVPQAYVASLLDAGEICAEAGLSRFEALALESARRAVESSGINPSGSDVVLIVATTKGSIEQMHHHADPYPTLGHSAQMIASRLGITTMPIVVSNACISGVSAILLGSRLVERHYRYAVVCGADAPGRFVISGFQSLKAMSAQPCRPFDMERMGLNLGEAAATVVLAREPKDGAWCIDAGAVRNDAFHISTPSKTADGLLLALQATLRGVDASSLAFINAHGTATLFNDQMESVAIKRAGLLNVPVNALKGYFGHTLGAAGVLETILSMRAAQDHTLPSTRGFEELGVSGRVMMSATPTTVSGNHFVKMISGFGGCNACIHVTQGEAGLQPSQPTQWHTAHTIAIAPGTVAVDGQPLNVAPVPDGTHWLTHLYKNLIGGYPKFYKMDALCRLGFVASELLLRAEADASPTNGGTDDSRAVLLFNRTSSVQADRAYLESIDDEQNCFPSPSAFVYTLPNIVTGEIAIRNGYHGETALYVLPERNEALMAQVLDATGDDTSITSAIVGWFDYADEAHYEAQLRIVQRPAES